MQGKVRQLTDKEQREIAKALKYYALHSGKVSEEVKRGDMELLALEFEMAKYVEVKG